MQANLKSKGGRRVAETESKGVGTSRVQRDKACGRDDRWRPTDKQNEAGRYEQSVNSGICGGSLRFS